MRFIAFCLALGLAATACAEPPVAPTPPDLINGELSLALAEPGPVEAGEPVSAELINGSLEEAMVGELSCVAEFEMKTANGWVRQGHLRQCIELLRVVPASGRLAFETPGPDGPGHYRIVIDAHTSTGKVTVRSADFRAE